MKRTLLILFLFLSIQCFGQKWHLNKVAKNETYPYKYWFHFEHLNDTCSYQISSKTESINSTIKILDNIEENVIFAIIKLININDNTEIQIITGNEGQLEHRIENGKYRLEIISFTYDDFNLEFEIENGKQIELTIKLGLSPELVNYQIDSKKELSEDKILEIIECVRINRKEFYKTCSDFINFIILMQI